MLEEISTHWKISLDEARQRTDRATIDLTLKYPDTEGFLEIPPEERLSVVRKILQQQYDSLKKDFAIKNIKIKGKRAEPRFLEARLPLMDLFRLAEKAYIQNVRVKEIAGIGREELTEDKNTKILFYAVKARFVILVEGQTKGLQSYEERIVLLKAENYQEAEDKALKMLPLQDEKPYLNSDKRFVWWKFEAILNICELSVQDLQDFNHDGVEVYAEIKGRRMKPEHAWILQYRQTESNAQGGES